MKDNSTHITLFVSSSFKDMHERRDILRNKVQPLLNEEANKAGYSVSFCDLRWGINSYGLEGSDRLNKTLRACLDAIDDCCPPVIVLLGKDYGTTGDEAAFREVCEEKGIILDSYDISYTDLEIDYAKARYNDLLIYMFDDDSVKDQRLSALRKRLITEYPDKTRIVESNEAFADYIYNDLRNILSTTWNKVYSASELERVRHWSFFYEKRSVFSVRYDELNLLYDRICSEQNKFVIKGPSGIGKSTLICELAYRLNDSGYQVMMIECGLTELSCTSMDVLRQVFVFLGITCGETSSAKAMLYAYRNQINSADVGKKVVVIDGINRLVGDEEAIIDLLMIPSAISFVISATSDINTKELPVYTPRPLTSSDVGEVIKGVLRPFHKEIENDVVNAILNKSEVKNPLYVSLLIHLLLIQDKDDYEQIRKSGEGISSQVERDRIRVAHQISIVEEASESLPGLVRESFDMVGNKIDPKFIGKVLGYIALSRFGLRDSDLERLMGDDWNDLSFHLLINFFQGFFIKRVDGRYDFSHSIFRFALHSSDDSYEANSELLIAFSSLPVNDPIRMKEYVYHLITADEKRLLINYIKDVSSDERLSGYAAENIYYICMRDEGKWISDLIKDCPEVKDGFVDFIIERVLTLFSINDRETQIKLGILKQIEGVLYTETDDNNRLSGLENLYLELATTSDDLDEHDSAARYVKAYFDINKSLNDSSNNEGRRRFIVYLNTLVILKNAVGNNEFGDWFFSIAEEGISNGTFDSGDIALQGSYLACMGEAYGRIRSYEKQLEIYKRGLALHKKGYEENPNNYNRNKLLGSYYNVGTGYALNNNHREALQYFRYAVSLNNDTELRSEDRARVAEIDTRISLYRNFGLSLLFTKTDLEEALTCKEEEIKWTIRYRRLKGNKTSGEDLIVDYIQEYEAWFNTLCSIDRSFKSRNMWRFVVFRGYINAIINGDIDVESQDSVELTIQINQKKYVFETQHGESGEEGLIVSDKSVFYGQISQGKKHGLGCSRYSGTQYGYRGMWKEDKYNGYGETHVYTGEWLDGEFDGYGISVQDGKRICGLWKHGQLVKKYPFFVVNNKLNSIKKSINMNTLDSYVEKVNKYIEDNQ